MVQAEVFSMKMILFHGRIFFDKYIYVKELKKMRILLGFINNISKNIR